MGTPTTQSLRAKTGCFSNDYRGWNKFQTIFSLLHKTTSNTATFRSEPDILQATVHKSVQQWLAEMLLYLMWFCAIVRRLFGIYSTLYKDAHVQLDKNQLWFDLKEGIAVMLRGCSLCVYGNQQY